jgi:hypothetical protein
MPISTRYPPAESGAFFLRVLVILLPLSTAMMPVCIVSIAVTDPPVRWRFVLGIDDAPRGRA